MNDRYEYGLNVMKEHLGKDAEKYVQAIADVSPLFARVNVEFAFGDLYGQEDSPLDQKTRELVAIAALTTLGTIPQLKLHIESALRVQVTKEEIADVITQMIAYCGFPHATNAIMAAKEVFNKLGV